MPRRSPVLLRSPSPSCPPHTTDAAKAAHIARHLSVGSFRRYLADETRTLFVAEADSGLAGYTMLVTGEPDDAGVAAALVAATVGEAARRGAVSVWLGVSQENARANRFYDKCGFEFGGANCFLVGDRHEDDYVRKRILDTVAH